MPSPADDRRSAFEREALPLLDVVYRVALRLSGDAADADDLTQETMLKALRAWDRFTPGTNLKAWLLTILRNTFINQYRRRQRETPMEVHELEQVARNVEAHDEDPEGTIFDSLIDEEVLRAVDQLPLDFRETVILSDLEGLSYQEIAEITNVPIGTVKSRLSRARQALQRRLYDYAVRMGYLKRAASS